MQMKRGAMLMARKTPRFVEVWRDRHGKILVYFRKGKGIRIPLPSSIGSDEFNAAYEAALTGQIAAQLAAVVTSAVLARPHRRPPFESGHHP